MITRIEIDGFKSFVDFSLDLHPFTAVIGTNASGKSNLVDAFRFLAELARGDIYDAVKAVRGDAETILHEYSDGSRVDEMRFAVEFETPGSWPETGRWRYEATIRTNRPSTSAPLVFSSEALSQWHDGAWTDLPADPAWDKAAAPGVSEAIASRWALSIRGLGVRSSGDSGSAALSRLWRNFASIRAVQLETRSLREVSRAGDRPFMEPDGTGLPRYLSHLREKTATEDDPRGLLREIAMMMHGVVPDVTDFRVIQDKERNDVRIQFKARYQGSLEADIVSGGTLRALAILAVLADPTENGPLLIDEPENGIYPEQFRRLLRVMQDVARGEGEDGRQVLVASHSPVILDAVPGEQVVFLDTVSRVGRGRKSQVTRARRAVASDTRDSTANWGPLSPTAVQRLKVGGELLD